VPEDATGWFERLYVAAGSGDAEVPWDRGGPNPNFASWVEARRSDGTFCPQGFSGARPSCVRLRP